MLMALKRLGLATEWIEIIKDTRKEKHWKVSVLRPSGLKYPVRTGKYSMTCLGLATEWIEISHSLFLLGWQQGLGLATEWIEILLLVIVKWLMCSLGLATEWIEMQRSNLIIRMPRSLGLATEWIEINPYGYGSDLSASRSCDRVD